MANLETTSTSPEQLSDAEVEKQFYEIVEEVDLVVTPEEQERLDLIQHAAKGANWPEAGHPHYRSS